MKKKWYNLLVILTLTAPMTIYLFLMATIFRITPDAYVYGEITQVEVIKDEFLYAKPLTQDVSFNGEVVLHEGAMALKFTEDDIIKFKDGYFRYQEEWVDIKVFAFNQELSYKLPLTFIIATIGVLFVALIVSNKMQWQKKKPRLATFIALLLTTALLAVLNFIIGSLLGVFVVATASFGLYCIEYLIQQNKITQETSDKATNELTDLLEMALRKIK